MDSPMKVVTISSFGAADVLSLESVEKPAAEKGRVVVAVEAAGVGLIDIYARQGLYPGRDKPGFVPGSEVAGTVIAVGDGVDAAWLGERVYALIPTGGYSEQIEIAVQNLVRIPAALSANEAVALGINALVGAAALRRAEVAAGDRLLVRGAAGGIGLMTTQLAALAGAEVTAISSTGDRLELLKRLGAKRGLLRDEGLAGGDSYDAIIDIVAGPELTAFIGKLGSNGRYIVCGIAGGPPPPDFGMGLLMAAQRSPLCGRLAIE